MKNAKNKKSFIITVFILICVFTVSAFSDVCAADSTSTGVKTVNKNLMQYCYLNLTFDKPESENYKCSVTNNKDKYITVSSNNEGSYYWLTVTSNKVTPKNKKPLISVYKEKDGKKTYIKKYQITVTSPKKVDMSNIKLNKNTSRQLKLKNPYDKDYRYEYNKKVIKLKCQYYDGDYEYPVIKGIKNGKTTVKAYIKGTKKLIGSFTVNVGNYKASVKKSYKEKTIYYNSHIDSALLNKGSFDLSNAISNYHSDGVYTVVAKNTNLIKTSTVPKAELNPKAVRVISKKTGTTTLTVYEKRGKAKKKKIGTIKLTIKKAKDSEVYSSYRELDNDGIFYENFISPGESYDLKSAVVKSYLNPFEKKYHFKESDYTFTAKSNKPSVVSVDSNGICYCHGFDMADDEVFHKITYTIKFKDGSKVTGSGSFDIVSEDFWD